MRHTAKDRAAQNAAYREDRAAPNAAYREDRAVNRGVAQLLRRRIETATAKPKKIHAASQGFGVPTPC